jgi:hypothetical protein
MVTEIVLVGLVIQWFHLRREARRRGMSVDELCDWYRHTQDCPRD